MTLGEQCKNMARLAKKRGYPLSKCVPDKEPFRTIFEDEYNRYQPRKVKSLSSCPDCGAKGEIRGHMTCMFPS